MESIEKSTSPGIAKELENLKLQQLKSSRFEGCLDTI
jgi:hypothetical protein